jgi:hypothetical protein
MNYTRLVDLELYSTHHVRRHATLCLWHSVCHCRVRSSFYKLLQGCQPYSYDLLAFLYKTYYNYYLQKKGPPKESRVLFCEYGSHEVLNKYSSVVLVNVSGEGLAVRNACRCLNEWVADHAVAGLESNLGLEGARIDRT